MMLFFSYGPPAQILELVIVPALVQWRLGLRSGFTIEFFFFTSGYLLKLVKGATASLTFVTSLQMG